MASWGKADFRQLKQLQKKLERLQRQEFDGFCRGAAKELAARLLGKVIPRTPVGRAPQFRGADGKKLPRAMKVKSVGGKKQSFLTREGAILERYWAGYVGGELRRGWTSRTEDEAKDGGEQDPVAYAKSLPVTKAGDEYTIEILNPVGYASYVEFGHRQQPGRFVPQLGKRLKASWVKGRFMLTISEMELKAQAPAVLEKKLAAFLKEAFGGGQ